MRRSRRLSWHLVLNEHFSRRAVSELVIIIIFFFPTLTSNEDDGGSHTRSEVTVFECRSWHCL